MNKQILTVHEDESGAGLGLICDGMTFRGEFCAAFSGLIIAHDIMEHQRGVHHIGTIGDELVALGGVWYVRGRWGMISRTSVDGPHYHIASDIVNMGRLRCWGIGIGFVPKSNAPHDIDVDIDEVIRISHEQMRDECEEQYDEDLITEYYHHARHGMRMGYNMAEDRYEGLCALTQFRAIESAVESVFPMCYYEGQQFELEWGDDEARIECLYEEDDL